MKISKVIQILLISAVALLGTSAFGQDNKAEQKYLIRGQYEFPNNWEEFLALFGYDEGGVCYDIYFEYFDYEFPKVPWSKEEIIKRLLDITTISKEVYSERIYIYDERASLQGIMYTFMLSHFHIFISELNERSYNENLNFWNFAFSGIERPHHSLEEMTIILDAHETIYGPGFYKYYDTCKTGYDIAIAQYDVH